MCRRCPRQYDVLIVPPEPVIGAGHRSRPSEPVIGAGYRSRPSEAVIGAGPRSLPAAPATMIRMGHRTSLALSMVVSVTVGVLLDAPRLGRRREPAEVATPCGIGGKDAAPAGTHCDDQNKCTTEDVCDGDGKCAGKPVLCPSLPCAIAACSPATGACARRTGPTGPGAAPAPARTGCARSTRPRSAESTPPRRFLRPRRRFGARARTVSMRGGGGSLAAPCRFLEIVGEKSAPFSD